MIIKELQKTSVFRSFRTLILLPALLFFSSCSARAQDAFPQEMAKVFEDAGLTLQRQKYQSRDFSLPIPTAAAIPETLNRHTGLGDLKGKIVFLNFWATWCGPCRDEMPSMEALYAKYKAKGLEILAVNSGDGAPEVLAFMKDLDLSFPVVLDRDGKVSRAYGIQAIPTSYLLDREGNVLTRLVGSINWNTAEIHAVLDLLLTR